MSRLVDQKGRFRRQEFRKIAVTSFRSYDPADVNGTRAAAIVHEQVDHIWFGTTARVNYKRNQAYMALSPWPKDTYSYFGANLAAPLKQDSQIALKNAPSLDPVEMKRRKRDDERERKAERDDGQMEEDVRYNAMLAKHVAHPRRKMREAGVNQAEIDAVVAAGFDILRTAFPGKKIRGPKAANGGQALMLPVTTSAATASVLAPSQPPAQMIKGRLIANTSRPGDACQRCRKRKQRCDGQRPCRRCQDDRQVCVPQP